MFTGVQQEGKHLTADRSVENKELQATRAEVFRCSWCWGVKRTMKPVSKQVDDLSLYIVFQNLAIIPKP